jgi:PadR family transcriptional regulator AphA
VPTATRNPRRSGPRRTEPPSGLAEQACLALVVQGVTHGWAIGSLLAPGGELGRAWTLSRPLTYRAIDGLADKGLLVRADAVPGRGRDRTVLRPTAAGRRRAAEWLDAPVEHLRDIRTELLLKLLLRRRAGQPLEPLLDAQLDRLAPAIDALTTTGDSSDPVVRWRRESARAVRRFLRDALADLDQPSGARPKEEPEMRISARNQLKATIDQVTHGEVMSTVATVLPDGQRVTAAITKEAAVELDLAAGDQVVLIIKSTEVLVAKPD